MARVTLRTRSGGQPLAVAELADGVSAADLQQALARFDVDFAVAVEPAVAVVGERMAPPVGVTTSEPAAPPRRKVRA